MTVAEPACVHCGEAIRYAPGPNEVPGGVMGAAWFHQATGKQECEPRLSSFDPRRTGW